MVSKLYSKHRLSIASSAQDNTVVSDWRLHIDNTQPIMEFSICKLFIINLIQLIRNKVALSKNFYIAPSEIDRMYYWEYEYFMEEVNRTIKEENERNQKQNEQYNSNSMMRNAKSYMPKMPSTPKMPSMPKF